MKQTTQEIYHNVRTIQINGNWIESPYRLVTWIPTAFVEKVIKGMMIDEEYKEVILKKLDISQ